MKCMTKYVVLDVHEATTSASVRSEGDSVLARAVLPTDEAAVLEFFRSMRGSVHVALEEGTQAQWLRDLLRPLVDRVVVCDRRGEKRCGNKADGVDADDLSELLRRGGLRAVYHGGSNRATLKELTRSYRNLVEDSTRVGIARSRSPNRGQADRGYYRPNKRLCRTLSRHNCVERLSLFAGT